jgi:hypothetical protein
MLTGGLLCQESSNLVSEYHTSFLKHAGNSTRLFLVEQEQEFMVQYATRHYKVLFSKKTRYQKPGEIGKNQANQELVKKAWKIDKKKESGSVKQ